MVVEGKDLGGAAATALPRTNRTYRMLTVCPTRGRASRCHEMLTSFFCTANPWNKIWLYVDKFDPQLGMYRLMFYEHPGVQWDCGNRMTVVEVFNTACSKFAAEYDYFCVCNDDFIFHTPGWDEKLIGAIEAMGGGGMAYGQTNNLPTCAVFSGKSIRKIGWWFPPGFKHQFVDNVQRDLYEAAGMLYHVPDVNVEHKHPDYGKAERDETYRHVYSEEIHRHDSEAYRVWKETRMAADVERLKGAVANP